MAGWIKIYRDITKHWIFQDAEKFKWWIDLLVMASHEEYRMLAQGSLILLKRGQLSVSLSFLASRWGRSKEKVLNFLRLLEEDNMIERKSDRKSTIITICNYDSYQDVSDQYPTANRPMSDQCPTEYKNVKECKEYNNTTTAHACTREEDYISRYREESMWSDVGSILHKPVAECQQLFSRWILEYQHNGDTHRDYSDFKKHFIQWARITIQKESKTLNNNGNNRSDYSRRGRADVPEDISVDF